MASEFLKRMAAQEQQKAEVGKESSKSTVPDESQQPSAFLLRMVKEEQERNAAKEQQEPTETQGNNNRTWFQKGSDNAGKAIVGSGADVIENLLAGLTGIGEKVIDAGAALAPYVAQGVAQSMGGSTPVNMNQQQAENQMLQSNKDLVSDFVAKDLYDEKQLSQKLVSDPLKKVTGIDTRTDSVFGEKTDALVQSGGQLLGTAALGAVGVPWWMTTGASALGSEAETALNSGATLEEAALSGAISAGAEILTEKISGGIKFGGKTLDDAITKKLANSISNKAVRALAKLGIDMAGEGAEEVISGTVSKFGQWLTYQDDQALNQMLFSEAALDEALESFIGGAVLGGVGSVAQGVRSETAGKDYVTGEKAAGVNTLPQTGSAAVGGQATQQGGQMGQADMDALIDETVAQLSGAPADPVNAAVESFESTGAVSNKQATDILNSVKAVQQIVQETGVKLDGLTMAQRRNAVKTAVEQIAQQKTAAEEEQKTTASEDTVVKEYISLEDYINKESPVWRNVDYTDDTTKATITQETHSQMVDSGSVVTVSDSVMKDVGQSFPDLRGMKKKERTPILKDAINKLKTNIRQFLSGLSNQNFEFEVNGKVLDAKLYSTGINEVLEKVTQEKANMLYSTQDIFRNARYLYSTPDYDGDPNVYRWNYFYTPVQIGEDTVGVRIAVRDVKRGTSDKLPESQIYNWGIKKDTSLDGGSHGPKVASSDVSSDASNNIIRKDSETVNTENGAVGAAERGFSEKYALIDEYGAIPEGENPVRADQLPKSTDGKDRVSYTPRTAMEAKVTPDEFVPLIENATVRGGFSFMPITNSETVEKAKAEITKKGWKKAKEDWIADVRKGKASPQITAVGALLYNNAVNSGDFESAMDILSDYAQTVRNSAQALQAARILKTLTPENRLHMIEKSVEQMVEDMHLDTDVTIDEALQDEYINAESEEARDEVITEMQKSIASQLPATFMEKFTALRYVNMLGNFRTQVKNVVGNLSMKGVRTVQNATAAALENIASKLSGGKLKRTRSATVSKEQKAAAAKDYANVKDLLIDGGKFKEADSTDAFMKGVQEQRRIFKSAPLEGYRKLTNWAMETGDLIFAKDAYARALAGYLKANGITETDYSKIDTAILDEARLFAAKEAQEATFRDTNWLSGWISKAGRRKDTPAPIKAISEGIMPFRKTPANVLIRAEEYSPLGIINSVVTSIRAMGKDSDITGAQVINSWAKSLTGTGLFGLGMLLQSLGALSTGPDEDEKKEGFEDLNGWQNYAITLPDGTNLTIDAFSPSAIPLLMGAELKKLIDENGFQLKDLEKALTSIAQPMIEMSMLQGVSDTLDNIQYAENNLGQLAINAAASYLTQGLTNTLLGQLERTFEGERMTTYVDKDSDIPDWLQRLIGKASAKIPGWDYQQIPYINAWGEEEENFEIGANAAYNLLSPSYIEKGVSNAVTQELNRLNEAQSDVNVYPARPDKTVTVNKQDYNLSAEEYVELAKLQGQTQKKLVEDILGSKNYGMLSDAEKAKAIRYAYEYARGKARGEIVPDHPGIETKWMAEREGNIAEGILRKVAAGTTEKFLGISIESAAYIADILDGLTAEPGKNTVRNVQELEAVVNAGKLTDKEQESALRDLMGDSLEKKFDAAQKMGIDADDFVAAYRKQLDTEGEGKKQKVLQYYIGTLGIDPAVAESLYKLYTGAK